MDAATSFGCASSGLDLLWRYLTEHDPKYEGKKKVKISGRELASVPAQVFGLDQLQVLEMSPERESCLRYRMELLPQEISRLRNLTCLYIDSNNLKKIPAEIGTLRQLERLTLSNNSLSSLPPEMGALQRLHSLHLANNSLTELPVPLCQLRSLTFLDVSDNKIDTIPSSVRHLEKLETLLLLFNSLESLPEDVCLLRNLCTLWLGNNRLRSLPVSFGEKKTGDTITVHAILRGIHWKVLPLKSAARALKRSEIISRHFIGHRGIRQLVSVLPK
ncbi:PREDICTED: plant intracellular Ras-group-related LRR protein 7-like [Tauraco erythrolophus]|uniref:plant intracellular Ras-group-related LRR protein 7-like n=1 Tax=Tauraco erythrolophus TaxID=121530 RepID=UPI0005234730|nr:PREDICTED: plant intracellular Ras-group-related LRR protein 7-like [Tauraco erythrolophus]